MITRKTQRAQILRLLVDARGEWVPLPEILALGIAQYNARIFELRRLGLSIENRVDPDAGGRHSWFRLVNPAEVAAPSEPPKNVPVSPFVQRRLEEEARELPLFAEVRS